jgi:catechol 2,3-dioxygenase-like lactoylglutathione lyase family enzyme
VLPDKRQNGSSTIDSLPSMFSKAAINVYSRDVVRLVAFYEGLGFRETFRTPQDGVPDHVEVVLDGFTIGIASVEAASADHGLNPNLGGRPVEIVLWTDDADGDYARLMADGAPSLSPPHDWLSDLRLAWLADPDGNPIQLAQHRKPDSSS